MDFKKVIQYIFSFGLTALLLWYVFKNIDLAAMWQQFKQADHQWLLLAGLSTVIAGWSRAYRWSMMFEPLGYKPSIFRMTLAVFVGYFANIFIPRAGEVARCGTLQRTDGVPIDKSLGTVVAERIIDVLSLLVLILINFVLEFNRLKDLFSDLFADNLKDPSKLIILGFCGIFALVFATYLSKKNREKIAQHPLYQKFRGLVIGLWSGFTSIRKLRKPMAFVFHTILIWSMYYLGSYLLFFCFAETSRLSPLAGLTVLVAGAMGMAAPTQGGVGAYHILVGNIVVLYGISQDSGIILATFLHACQTYLFVPILGVISLILLLFVPKTNKST